MEINRRSLITGLVSFMAAPAIVRIGSLMPVKSMLLEPVDLCLNVMMGNGMFLAVPLSSLRAATINDERILGVVSHPTPGTGFYPGDVVSLR